MARNGGHNGQYDNNDMMVDNPSDYHSADYLGSNNNSGTGNNRYGTHYAN